MNYVLRELDTGNCLLLAASTHAQAVAELDRRAALLPTDYDCLPCGDWVVAFRSGEDDAAA